MAKCPNCGQKTRGDYCQYCNYPILRGRRVRPRRIEKRAGKLAQKQAELEAKEKTKRKAEEAKKAKEAEKLSWLPQPLS